MLIQKEILNKILWATIEDFAGLWELTWEVSQLKPSPYSSSEELTRKILQHFLDAGLINLFYDKWGGDQLLEIAREESIKIIIGEKYWSPPEVGDLCVKVSASKEGEKVYREELITDFEISETPLL